MSKENLAQEVVENLLTDPDHDADKVPAPKPPQTIEAEPSGGEAAKR